MRLENLRVEESGDTVRALATVIWEDCPRPTQELYFETARDVAESLSCNAHAFLVACSIPAMYFGEERVFVEGEICPDLKDGIETAMNWLRFWWYKPTKKLPKIESKTRSMPLLPQKHARAGLFFSGGIDALATLRTNRLSYPSEHPGSIKDALVVCGLEIRERRIFRYVLDSLSVLAGEAGIELIPIHTNIRSLGPEKDHVFWGEFWTKEFLGAAFSAIAYAFAKRLTRVYISSGHDIPNIKPNGSHPLVEPNFSCYDFKIVHALINLSRFERVKLVANWELCLKHMRVCNNSQDYQPGKFNCGKCEKCVRTMLALLATGDLERASAFPFRDLSEEHVIEAINMGWNTLLFYEELIGPLKKKGRLDLVRVLERKMIEYYKLERLKKLKKIFIEPIKEYDRMYFGGNFLKLKRTFY